MASAPLPSSADHDPGHHNRRVFISYRRDDASGYAGRLEGSLERRLGAGTAFRDILDIAPGDDFEQVIRQRLAGAAGVVVLIGPRWAAGEAPGKRRIDDPQDFVRREVQAALESDARVVPVLLPGATMPSEADLPLPLKTLARRNALSISEAHWEADVDRLVASLGVMRPRAVWPWALGGAALAASVVAAWCWLPSLTTPDTETRLLGVWQAEVTYDWGYQHTERLAFMRHAGELTGTADYLGRPRAIDKLSLNGPNLRFETRSAVSMGSEEREETHTYTAELRGQPPDEVLAFRLQSAGGFGSHRPIVFEARRVAAPAAASASGGG